MASGFPYISKEESKGRYKKRERRKSKRTTNGMAVSTFLSIITLAIN